MERPRIRPSTYGWMAIAGGVAVYDMLCPRGEQLSERYDEWMEDPKKRALAIGVTAMTALHLCSMLPERVDLIHHVASIRRH